jgi:hypothetical protein
VPFAGWIGRFPGSLAAMRVELHRPDEPDAVVATVGWIGGDAVVDTDDDAIRTSLGKVFRRTPVVIDDASYRRLGTSGAVLIQPGDSGWFRAVVQSRIPAEAGLVGRFVPGVTEGGFDPAAGYRTFEEQIERLTM